MSQSQIQFPKQQSRALCLFDMYLTIIISDDSSPLGRLRQRKYAEDAFGDFFASCQASTDQKMWNQSYKIKIYCLSRFAPIWANFNMIRHIFFKLHCQRYRFSQTIQSFLKSSIFVDTPVMLEKHESQSPCPMSILLSFSLFRQRRLWFDLNGGLTVINGSQALK